MDDAPRAGWRRLRSQIPSLIYVGGFASFNPLRRSWGLFDKGASAEVIGQISPYAAGLSKTFPTFRMNAGFG